MHATSLSSLRTETAPIAEVKEIDDPGDGPEKSSPRESAAGGSALLRHVRVRLSGLRFSMDGGRSLSEPDAAWAAFSSPSSMAILLSHEMAHYWVAKAHSSRSASYFLPFPLRLGRSVPSFGCAHYRRLAQACWRWGRRVRWLDLRLPSSPSCSDSQRRKSMLRPNSSGIPPSWMRSQLRSKRRRGWLPHWSRSWHGSGQTPIPSRSR